MGYACPVCDVPQQDAEHLANHLAFTAMVHGDDHETWLDDHVPGWDQLGPDELGPRVAEHAPETTYDEVFEDTVDRRGDHESLFDDDHDHDHGHDHGHRAAAHAQHGRDPGDLDAEARQILEEAVELTERMVGDDADTDTAGGDADGKES